MYHGVGEAVEKKRGGWGGGLGLFKIWWSARPPYYISTAWSSTRLHGGSSILQIIYHGCRPYDFC